jgi:hypothetical protein
MNTFCPLTKPNREYIFYPLPFLLYHAMADTNFPQYIKKAQETKEERTCFPQRRKTPQDVRQDKIGLSSDRVASGQPDRIAAELRSDEEERFSAQSQNEFEYEGTLVPLQIWVKPIVKDETIRRAKRAGVSTSKFGRYVYERALQNHIDLEYSPLLIPVLQQTLRQENRRVADLVVSTSRDAQIAKQLASYILEHLPGMSKTTVENLLKLAVARTNEEMGKRLKNVTNREPNTLTVSLSSGGCL